MASRINITVNARDETQGALARVRQSMNRLGDDMDRTFGQNNRQNFDRMNHSLRQMGEDLNRLHGRIPDDEFQRLARSMRDADNVVARGRLFGMNNQSFGELRQALRSLDRDFTRVSGHMGSGGGIRVRVRPDVDRNRFRQALMAPLHGLQGLMSDGIGQALGNAFQTAAKNPVVFAGLAAVVAAAAGLIGAGLAGALTLAFGGAFVGLAGVIASKAPVVKKAWSGMVDDVKSSWASAGKAMEPVITHGITLLGKMADTFLPHFKEAMRQSQGPMTMFLDSVSRGIIEFGRRAFKPMMEGFNALLLAFGPEFESLMGGMGDSFGALGRTVRDHSGEIAMALRMIFGLITTIIDIVNFLANVWISMARIALFNIGAIINYGLVPLAQAAMSTMKMILDSATIGLGWMPGLGDKVKAAKEEFYKFGDGVVNKLRGMGDEAMNWGDNMDKANKERKLKVDLMQWQADLQAAKADLKAAMTPKEKAKLRADLKGWNADLAEAKKKLETATKAKTKAKIEADIKDLEQKIKTAKQLLADQDRRKSKSQIKGDIRDLEDKIGAAKRMLARQQGRSATSKVKANISDLVNKLNQASGRLRSIDGRTANTYVYTIYRSRDERASKKFAKGGVVGMASGGPARSGSDRMTLVGEEGPEMVKLPPGSMVKPAGATRAALRDQGGGMATLVLKSSGRRADDLLLELLRESIHQRGGDPVKVLGGK
jgi:hypothetical protein